MELEEIRSKLKLLSVYEHGKEIRKKVALTQEVYVNNRQTGRSTESAIHALHHLSLGKSVAVIGSTKKTSDLLKKRVCKMAFDLDCGIDTNKIESETIQRFIDGYVTQDIVVFDHTVKEHCSWG